jgi:flagellar biosynthesis/type III secretory pathway M-ring protein FliF/YscJ
MRYQHFAVPAMKYVSFLLLFLLVYLILFRPIRNRVLQGVTPPAAAGPESTALPAGDSVRVIAGTVASEGAALPAGVESEGTAAATPRQLGEGSEGEAESDEGLDFAAIDKKLERDFMKEAQMLDLGTRKYSVLKKRLMESAAKDPESIAQLVRTWIAERN